MPGISDYMEYASRMLGQEAYRSQQEYIARMMGMSDIGAISPTPSRERRKPEDAKEPKTVAVATTEALDEEFTALYRELATDIGIDTTPLETERFKAFVTERGLTVYNRADVDEYLHHKYRVPQGNITGEVVWGWRPLRAADRKDKHSDSKNGSLQRGAVPYKKAIPYPVLLTIRAILGVFSTAKFFVSDEMHAERIPDPFLLVEIGEEQFIVERWDEPAFREKSKA